MAIENIRTGAARRAELVELFQDIPDAGNVVMPLIDDVVFLERNLKALRRMPFIVADPVRPFIQKATPAAKQYKELLQQYNNCIKILTTALRKDAPADEGPLSEWLRQNMPDE